MNKIYRILFAIAVLIAAAYVVKAATETSMNTEWANIKISFVNQDPDPAEPGKYVDLRFKLENNGSAIARNIDVELLPEYPFSLDRGVSPLKNIGSVRGRQTGNAGAVIKYHIRVDKDAIEGTNEIKLRYRLDNGAWIKIDAFNIQLRTFDAFVSIEDIIMEPDFLRPGKATPVTIKIANIADSLIKNVKLKLDFTGIPIAPIGSSSEKTITQIAGKETAPIEFRLMPEADADSQVYKIPIRLDYIDNTGTLYNKTGTIGLVVGDKPDLATAIDSSTIYQKNKAGKITIKFVNKGVIDLKFLNAKLVETDDFRIISADEVYVGNVDSDDYETADFDLYVGRVKGNLKLPLIIEYKDANNNDYKEKIELELPLYSGSQAKKFGLVEGSSFVGFLVLIIIVGAGLFFYRKWKKKKKA